MNHIEHPNDTMLTQDLRDSLSGLAAPERPPLAAIINKGRARRRQRLAGFAGLGGAGAAAGTALALGLTGVLGAPPARILGAAAARSAGTSKASPAAGSTSAIRTTAFTLTRNANGTDTLTLPMSEMLDPAAFQRALAQHGIPALVKSGTYCWSSPAAPDPHSLGVLSIRPPAGKAYAATRVSSGPEPSGLNRLAAGTVTVINPAAIPAGTELFFGYSSTARAVFTDLIYTSRYTCGSQPPPATP